MNDEEYRNYLKGLCLANLPVPFYGLYLSHITIKDIVEMGETVYRKTILPISLSKEVILKDCNIDIELIDLLMSTEELASYRENLIKLLSLVFKVEFKDITIASLDGVHNEIIIKNKLFMNNNIFKNFKDIVLFMNKLKEIKLKDLSDNKFKSSDETYNKRLEVFYKGKAEYEEIKKNENTDEILNLYSFIVHIQNTVDYERVLKLNVYQLYNSAKELTKKEDYNFTRNIYSSGQVSLKGVEIPNYYNLISKDNR